MCEGRCEENLLRICKVLYIYCNIISIQTLYRLSKLFFCISGFLHYMLDGGENISRTKYRIHLKVSGEFLRSAMNTGIYIILM